MEVRFGDGEVIRLDCSERICLRISDVWVAAICTTEAYVLRDDRSIVIVGADNGFDIWMLIQ